MYFRMNELPADTHTRSKRPHAMTERKEVDCDKTFHCRQINKTADLHTDIHEIAIFRTQNEAIAKWMDLLEK